MASLVGWKDRPFTITVYDTTKQIVAEPDDVQAQATRVRCSNDVSDKSTGNWWSQHRGKEEVLMHLVGEGSFTDRRLVRDGKVSLPGKVVTVARHLGSHLGEKASFAHELPRQRQATMTAFYSVGQLWHESRVSWRLKRCFFIGRGQHSSIWNRGLLSLESTVSIAYVVGDLSGQEGDGRGSGEKGRAHGRVLTMSNKEVLRFWKLAPCDVEARVRRLKMGTDFGAGSCAPHTIDHCHVWEAAVRA